MEAQIKYNGEFKVIDTPEKAYVLGLIYSDGYVKYNNGYRHTIVLHNDDVELLELIKTKSFCEIGRIYGVSDNSIRKWCKKEGLPSTKTELKKYLCN